MYLYVGFITYGESTAKYLPYFLPSLKNQTFKDFKVLAIDNSETQDNENAIYIKKNFPEISLKWAGENLGFAKAFNIMIRRAVEDGAEYFLALNPDITLETNTVEKLIEEMNKNKGLGSATAKVLKWDFNKRQKTNIIDSCGIKLLSGLRFINCNEGKKDGIKCCDKIIGPSGACAIYRLSVLEKVKQNGQYFDERMFMYKEDCDLAYRLFLEGFTARCVGNAIVYHDRSGSGAGAGDLAVALNRKNKSRKVKQWSFLNQQIIFLKYWKLQNFRNKLAIVWYEIKMLVFAAIFEPYLFSVFKDLKKIKSEIYK